MEDLLYDVTTLARIIIEKDIPIKESQKLLDRIWEFEKEFLYLEYRFDKKKFMLDVMEEVNYWQDKDIIDEEINAVNRDFEAIGSGCQYIEGTEYYNLRSYFMELRLRMLFIDNQDYIRMKLRTLLRDHGYKRRTAGLNAYLKQCMYFYHIETFIRGGEVCDIERISLDDMITFRLLGNYREFIIDNEDSFC